MDFTLDKKHLMARQLFKDFAEKEVRRLMRRSASPVRRWRRWRRPDLWASRFRRNMADRDAIR